MKHFFFMKEALKEAKKAFYKGEVPIGSVAVFNDKIIARAHNNKKRSNLFYSHAEFLVLKKINKKIKDYRMNNIVFYTTLEPCIMCMGALIQTRISKLYFGATNLKSGFIEHFHSKSKNFNFLNKISVESGFLAEESKMILQKFFSNLRKKIIF